MIDNLIFGGIGFIDGFFAGFMLAGLLVSAKRYDVDEYDYEEEE